MMTGLGCRGVMRGYWRKPHQGPARTQLSSSSSSSSSLYFVWVWFWNIVAILKKFDWSALLFRLFLMQEVTYLAASRAHFIPRTVISF